MQQPELSTEEGPARIIKFLQDRVGKRQFNVDEYKNYSLTLDRSSFMRKPKLRKKNAIPSKLQKTLNIQDLKKNIGRYEVYLPLHDMWVQYFGDMMNLKNIKNTTSDRTQTYAKLFKADYHGCIVKVTRSKNPSNIGITGIILIETRNVFHIITKDDVLKSIPKTNNVFTFEVEGFTFTLYGNHFRVKASERAVKKLKNKPSLDI